MKVLVSGASGYVGARVYNDLYQNHEVVGTFHQNDFFEEFQKVDITDESSVLEVVSANQPDIIVHAAAIASRSQCKENPRDAIATNVRGTENVVKAANRHGVQVIYISSLGAIEPDSTYGKTKLLGEGHVKNTKAGYEVLRASMTFGYSPNTLNDRPFNRIVQTLQEGHPVRYDDSWMFQPTYLKHVSEIIQQIIEEGLNNRMIDVLIPEFKTRFEIASDILKPFDGQTQPVMKRQSRTRTEEYRETNPEFPTWSYNNMIRSITQEIHDHDLASI